MQREIDWGLYCLDYKELQDLVGLVDYYYNSWTGQKDSIVDKDYMEVQVVGTDQGEVDFDRLILDHLAAHMRDYMKKVLDYVVEIDFGLSGQKMDWDLYWDFDIGLLIFLNL